MTTEPYSTEAILRRNIADMEVAMRTQTERAEAAEAELAKLREQKPVMKYMGRRLTPKDTMESWGIDCDVNVRPEMGTPLYAGPVPAPHKGATHCDDCGLTWLDDGLNPLGCPYCKDAAPATAVPSVPADCRQRLYKEGKPYPRSSCAVCGQFSPRHRQCDALLQSAPKADAVPVEWREVMAELAADLQSACDAEHPHRDQYPSVMRKYNNDMEIVEKARALLQSAEVRHD